MANVILPGLVDVHTHLRVPGGEQKEDFASGTAAALAGGFTMILAMPNTNPPLSKAEVMRETRRIAARAIHCDVGLFAGASPLDIDLLPACAPYSIALKIYLNDTYGPLRVEKLATLEACFANWPTEKLIAMHAEGQSVAVGIGMAAAYNRPVHFCHISRKEEIVLIARAKDSGLPVTCEVTPHHLFLTANAEAELGPYGDMRPRLASKEDVDSLWQHINSTIDCIATDHAPHTREEKDGLTPPPGVPGLETALPLMLSAVHDGRLTIDRLIELMSENPRRIYDLPDQPNTWVEVDPNASYCVGDQQLLTKCGWSPFRGLTVYGRIERVILRGKPVFKEGKVLAVKGSGFLYPPDDGDVQD
jgi:dihydroorotase